MMARFIVTIREVLEGDFAVEANTMEEAEKKVRACHDDCGEPLSGDLKLYTTQMTAKIVDKDNEEEKEIWVI
jgi:hypothetical protein